MKCRWKAGWCAPAWGWCWWVRARPQSCSSPATYPRTRACTPRSTIGLFSVNIEQRNGRREEGKIEKKMLIKSVGYTKYSTYLLRKKTIFLTWRKWKHRQSKWLNTLFSLISVPRIQILYFWPISYRIPIQTHNYDRIWICTVMSCFFRLKCQNQGWGLVSGKDPYSLSCWIRIFIQNTDPDPNSY